MPWRSAQPERFLPRFVCCEVEKSMLALVWDDIWWNYMEGDKTSSSEQCYDPFWHFPLSLATFPSYPQKSFSCERLRKPTKRKSSWNWVLETYGEKSRRKLIGTNLAQHGTAERCYKSLEFHSFVPPLSSLSAFRLFLSASSFSPILSHISYLINLFPRKERNLC